VNLLPCITKDGCALWNLSSFPLFSALNADMTSGALTAIWSPWGYKQRKGQKAFRDTCHWTNASSPTSMFSIWEKQTLICFWYYPFYVICKQNHPISFITPTMPARKPWFSLFCQWGNWGTKSLNDLFEAACWSHHFTSISWILCRI
jgi:hypothetical protein